MAIAPPVALAGASLSSSLLVGLVDRNNLLLVLDSDRWRLTQDVVRGEATPWILHSGHALAGLLLSWWHRALRRDASAARVGGSCAAVTAPATTMTVRALRLRTAEPSGWAQKLRGVCL